MPNAGDEMVKDIVASPHDGGLRLIYADWCEDHGRAIHAAFIRSQFDVEGRGYPLDLSGVPTHHCARCGALWVRHTNRGDWSLCSAACGPCCDNADMAGSPVCPLPPDDSRALLRMDDLIRLAAHSWIDESLPDDLQDGFGAWTHQGARVRSKGSACRAVEFRRGFIEAIEISLAGFLRNAAELFRACPITRVTLSDQQPREVSDRLGNGWTWSRWRDGTANAYMIPDSIRDRIIKANPRYVIDGGYFRLPSRRLALELLSIACVDEGRERAGLPRLDR